MMKLSEAIRLGAMLKPQGRGRFVNKNGQTCAFGAALDAVGRLECYGAHPAGLWPWITTTAVVLSPTALVASRVSVFWAIVTLNDGARWTREQIADWVATIEPADSAAVSVDVPTVGMSDRPVKPGVAGSNPVVHRT